MRKLLTTLFILFATVHPALATDAQLSGPIDIPQMGWDKVLQVSNGNTFLFHFEPRKSILIKLYDKERKEIASVKFIGKVIDNNALERSEIHGIYEIGGQAVIFISQAVLNTETLVRICFDINTGKLVGEKKVIISKAYKQNYEFSLVRNTVSGGYAVFCMLDLETNFKDSPHLEIFDEKHNKVRDVKLDMHPTEYDYTNHVNTIIDNNGGVVVLMNSSKIITYPNDLENNLAVAYCAPNDSVFHSVKTTLPKMVGPYYGMYTYNHFAKSLNIFLVGATSYVRKYGFQKIGQVMYSNFMLRYPDDNLGAMKYAHIGYDMATKQSKEAAGIHKTISPIPLCAYTNKYGMTTLISEEIIGNLRYANGETGGTYVGDIVVTNLSDDGKEIWNHIIPQRQFVRNTVSPAEIYQRGKKTNLFRREDPLSDWLYQFVSFYSCRTTSGDLYILTNDLRSNYDKKIGENIDSISTYTMKDILDTDGICYKVGKKKEVSKDYFLPGLIGETSTIMIESADYNEQQNSIAALVLQLSEGKYITRLCWRKLD